MPKKKYEQETKPLTEEFVVQQIGKVLEVVESNRKTLESKIEYSRKDAREQLESVARGLNQKIDNVEKRLSQEIQSVRSELKQTQVAVREVKGDTIRIEKKLDAVVEKVDCHDEEIVFLKTAVSKS